MEFLSRFSGIVVSCAFLLSLTACQHNYYKREIVGSWWGVDWQVKGETQPGSKQIWFEFNADSTYSSVFGGLQQSGKYWIDTYRLYTVAEGETPIKVKIESLREDTLTITMNRGGQPELLILSRKK